MCVRILKNLYILFFKNIYFFILQLFPSLYRGIQFFTLKNIYFDGFFGGGGGFFFDEFAVENTWSNNVECTLNCSGSIFPPVSLCDSANNEYAFIKA